jgi:hypothetical protein
MRRLAGSVKQVYGHLEEAMSRTMSNTKMITISDSQDVWLQIGGLTWSRLPARLKSELLEGIARIAGIREDIARQAKVAAMPPVEVVGQIWVVRTLPSDALAPSQFEGTIGGMLWPLRFQKDIVFGVRLPVLTAMCKDAATVRRILVHEFLHSFHFAVMLTGGLLRGETGLKINHNPFDAKDDDSLLDNPEDWFGGDDAKSLIHHDDQVLDLIGERYVELKPFFPVIVPEVKFETKKISFPESVREGAMELIGRRKEAQSPDTIV